MICTPLQILLGDKIEKNEMGRACTAYGGEESQHLALYGSTVLQNSV